MLSKNQVKYLRALHKKKVRREQGKFLVEGEKVVAELLASHWPIEKLYATPEFSDAYRSPIKRANIDITHCSATELTSVSTLVSNSAALAVVSIPEQSAPKLQPHDWLLALDNINDPGNLGSLLVSALKSAPL